MIPYNHGGNCPLKCTLLLSTRESSCYKYSITSEIDHMSESHPFLNPQLVYLLWIVYCASLDTSFSKLRLLMFSLIFHLNNLTRNLCILQHPLRPRDPFLVPHQWIPDGNDYTIIHVFLSPIILKYFLSSVTIFVMTLF